MPRAGRLPGQLKAVDQPSQSADVPEPPAGMNAEAGEHWKSLAPELHRLGRLSVLDLKAFRGLCESLALADKAQTDLLSEGLTLADAKCRRYPNPNMTVYSDAMRLAKAMLEAFGMSPAARTRVPRSAKPIKSEESFTDF